MIVINSARNIIFYQRHSVVQFKMSFTDFMVEDFGVMHFRILA